MCVLYDENLKDYNFEDIKYKLSSTAITALH